MTTLRTARDRARAEVRAEILAVARDHLARGGAAALSLRAVARELGLVSSAVYRYFENRDQLLTALIVDAYDALGQAAEDAIEGHADEAPMVRWSAAAEAIRAWAHEHPHEYALLYGTPVPGYAAPQDTVGPGSRVPLALMRIVSDAATARRTRRTTGAGTAAGAAVGVELDAALVADLERLRDEVAPGVAVELVFAALLAWTQLFGLLTFELFGQTRGVVEHHDLLFRDAVRSMGTRLGW